MSVYVDELRQTMQPSHGKFRYRYYCHLTADTPDELHRFASYLGLKRQWFQDHPFHPHYDITASMRDKAIEDGAVVVSSKDQAKKRLNIPIRS